MTPAPLETLLGQRWSVVAATATLTLPYWSDRISKLLNLDGALGEAAHFELEPAWAMVATAILIQRGGSALLILRRWSQVGVGALGVFTALATVVARPFWQKADPATRFQQRNTFLEHVGLIGELMLAAISARPKGVDR